MQVHLYKIINHYDQLFLIMLNENDIWCTYEEDHKAKERALRILNNGSAEVDKLALNTDKHVEILLLDVSFEEAWAYCQMSKVLGI